MSYAETLAEASKYDVDKLLDRAGIRGGTAKEQANKLANNSRVCYMKEFNREYSLPYFISIHV
jgi:hypothetical protein